MKPVLIALISILLVLYACESKPNGMNEKSHASFKGKKARVSTAYSNEGCEVLLQVIEDDVEVLLMPINLDKAYQIDGVLLTVEYRSSRIAQSKCSLGRPVIIDRAKLVE